MKVPMRKYFTNTLKIKLSVSVLIMTLPLVGMLLYHHFYAVQVVREQVSDSYRSTLSYYMDQIDSGLNDVDAYMNSVAGGGSDLISLGLAENDDTYYLSKVYLSNKLKNDIALYPKLGSFFVYVAPRDEYMDIYNRVISYDQKMNIQKYIVENIANHELRVEYGLKRWQHVKIGDEYYLINIVRTGDIYLGAWFHVEQLLQPLQSLKLGDGGIVLLTDEDGIPLSNTTFVQDHGVMLNQVLADYYLSGEDVEYLTVGIPSIRGNFSSWVLVPDKSILDNLPYLQKLIWVIVLAALFFIPIGLYSIRQTILTPLSHVLNAMKRVQSGDWSSRVDTFRGSDEFILLSRSFNSMMDEIQALRTNVFEEQLEKQKEELQRLQLQMNPHFFLNSLNIVYNLAKVKNYKLIQEMTMSLIHFFRYLFRSNTTFVKLKEELEHTQNYLKIQSLRFPDKLTWQIEAPVYLSEVPVPPLVIQTFVENSIKHGITMEEPIEIRIDVRFLDEENGSKFLIHIQDTGPGFSQHMLEELQAGRSVENHLGEHTGIWNVQRRLGILYGLHASVQFENDQHNGGAVVLIKLPIYPNVEARS